MKAVLLLLGIVFLFLQSMSGQPKSDSAATAERKLDHLEANGSSPHPDPAPTQLSEDEINAYFASGHVALPAGVESVHFHAEPGIVTATTKVDFDKVRAGQSSMNPLLAVFTGVHDVVVVAHAHGAGGTGYVHIDSVVLDGVEIPRFALQLFVERFLQPKYPEVGLDSQFKLPSRIDSATVGAGSLTLVQK
jgi:hypothetical protein